MRQGKDGADYQPDLAGNQVGQGHQAVAVFVTVIDPGPPGRGRFEEVTPQAHVPGNILVAVHHVKFIQQFAHSSTLIRRIRLKKMTAPAKVANTGRPPKLSQVNFKMRARVNPTVAPPTAASR